MLETTLGTAVLSTGLSTDERLITGPGVPPMGRTETIVLGVEVDAATERFEMAGAPVGVPPPPRVVMIPGMVRMPGIVIPGRDTTGREMTGNDRLGSKVGMASVMPGSRLPGRSTEAPTVMPPPPVPGIPAETPAVTPGRPTERLIPGCVPVMTAAGTVSVTVTVTALVESPTTWVTTVVMHVVVIGPSQGRLVGRRGGTGLTTPERMPRTIWAAAATIWAGSVSCDNWMSCWSRTGPTCDQGS